jgi:hypothetical protein
VTRPSHAADVSAVWHEARTALFATDLPQRQELFSVKLTRVERMLDPQTRRVINLQTRENTGVTRNPFVSLPAAHALQHQPGANARAFFRKTGVRREGSRHMPSVVR